jgi:hypothetical protein
MMVVREHGEAEAADCVRLAFDLAARMLSRGAARLMSAPGSVLAGAIAASTIPPDTATTNRDDAHD